MNLVYRRHLCVLFALVAMFSRPARSEEYDREPINYSQAEPDNPVSQLAGRLEAGTRRLEHHARFGYLPSLLRALDIPTASQTLVFSKTSLQRERISPASPRALYFNDDVYVGYCRNGEVLEISAADPRLGTVFYSLSQDRGERPRFVRQTDNCLICHASSQTHQVPGHVLRSVFVGPSGLPILSAGTHRTDQTSPLEERWGGWYVTGTHGSQKHLGNFASQRRDVVDAPENLAGMNLTMLGDRFDRAAYLSDQSDIVALLVLAHQTEMHNRITQANFAARQAMHYQQSLNRELGEPENHVWDSTKSRIRSAGEPLVEYLLFSGETPLTDPIAGSASFAEEFVRRGPRDRHGRSLRDFDLRQRLFRYPCSYLVYSPSFRSLPREIRDYVFARLRSILKGEDQTKPFSHLAPADRQAILEILRDTVPDLPEAWRVSVATTR